MADHRREALHGVHNRVIRQGRRDKTMVRSRIRPRELECPAQEVAAKATFTLSAGTAARGVRCTAGILKNTSRHAGASRLHAKGN